MSQADLVALQKHEFQQGFRWDIDFKAVFALNGMSAVKAKKTTFTHLCESFDYPTVDTQVGSADFRGIKVFQGGITDFGNTQDFTFVENVNSDVMDVLWAWHNMVSNTSAAALTAVPTGTAVGGAWLSSLAPVDYKCLIPMYRVNGRKERIYGVILAGAFCTKIAPGGSADGSTNDFAKPILSVSFDAFYRWEKGTTI